VNKLWIGFHVSHADILNRTQSNFTGTDKQRVWRFHTCRRHSRSSLSERRRNDLTKHVIRSDPKHGLPLRSAPAQHRFPLYRATGVPPPFFPPHSPCWSSAVRWDRRSKLFNFGIVGPSVVLLIVSTRHRESLLPYMLYLSWPRSEKVERSKGT